MSACHKSETAAPDAIDQIEGIIAGAWEEADSPVVTGELQEKLEKALEGTGGLYAGASLAHLLTFCLIPLFITAVNHRKIRSGGDLLMLRSGFGIAPEDEYAQTVTDLEGAVAASEAVIAFCESRGIDRRTAGRLGLAAEEMTANIIQHGFHDGKPHSIDLRALFKQEEGVTLIIRDNCRPFDPKERFRYLTDDDPTANIGLRLTMNLAREVTYTSAMRLNNVTIKM